MLIFISIFFVHMPLITLKLAVIVFKELFLFAAIDLQDVNFCITSRVLVFQL